ncbi:MAG: hypothetical protein FWC73_10755 [Defluviitaleaceae bacterium]|nr:hypothetical protein [Defluviitaleaceae bacterium]
MENQGFEDLKKQFAAADVETKIDIYVQREDLTQDQYRELLRMFPLNELKRLEMALAS